MVKDAHTYITPSGYDRFREELQNLVRTERPEVVEVVSWAAGNGDRSENGDYIYGKKRLREIDRRIRFLDKRLKNAKIVDPVDQTNREQVFFGARVTFVNDDDVERTVRIVGVDEADIEDGNVSLASPVARVLMKTRVGDVVEFHAPGGETSLEILEISYDPD